MKTKTKDILLVILGLALLISFPLLLVGGLNLMGLSVGLSFKSWLGASLILAVLVIVNRLAVMNIIINSKK